MSNAKRERHTKEDDSNNINIKRPTCLKWLKVNGSVFIVLLLLLNMHLSFIWIIYTLFIKKNRFNS